MTEYETSQFATFKDCIARRLLHSVTHDPSSESDSDGNDSTSALDDDDFASYLAAESWPALPDTVKNATHESKSIVPDAHSISFHSLSPDFTDSLISYGIAPDADDAFVFLVKATEDYLCIACAPPPPWSSTRTTECEICAREVPLTYHHLIPRSVHAKALKKGWHPESMLNSVAWLCRQVLDVL